jgi:hypothetical protein
MRREQTDRENARRRQGNTHGWPPSAFDSEA